MSSERLASDRELHCVSAPRRKQQFTPATSALGHLRRLGRVSTTSGLLLTADVGESSRLGQSVLLQGTRPFEAQFIALRQCYTRRLVCSKMRTMQRACVGTVCCISTRSCRQSSAAAELLAAEHRPGLLNLNPASGRGAFPGERRARVSQLTGSKIHEEQTSSRCCDIAATHDDVERYQRPPDLRPLAKGGPAGRAKGAKCLCWAAGCRPIPDLGFEALHLSRWAKDQHLDVQVMRRLVIGCRKGL